jgi:hypothetical protein
MVAVLGTMVLLACADSPTDPQFGIDSVADVALTIERPAPVPHLAPQGSEGTSARFSPAVAIADAADRLVFGIHDLAGRSALQVHLRQVEAYWLGGQQHLANQAVKSSRQVLSRIVALERGSAELDAIELALHDAANAFATP